MGERYCFVDRDLSRVGGFKFTEAQLCGEDLFTNHEDLPILQQELIEFATSPEISFLTVDFNERFS